MAKKPESRLQKQIKDHLGKQFPGCKFFKVWGGPFTEAGLPDLVGCINGQFYGFEVKRPVRSSKPSDIQIQTLKDFRRAGAIACVVVSPAEAEEVVRQTQALPEDSRILRVDPVSGRPCLRPSDGKDLGGDGINRAAGTRQRTRRGPSD